MKSTYQISLRLSTEEYLEVVKACKDNHLSQREVLMIGVEKLLDK